MKAHFLPLPSISTFRGILLAAALALATSQAPAVPIGDLLGADPAPRAVVYKKTPAGNEELFQFLPSDLKPGERRAAVVCIHGGAWRAGSADAFFPHARYFARRGAVGFSIDYRLFKPEGPSVADCLSDCKSAIRYIRAHAGELGVDPDRIAVLGDSAGGHLAGALGTVDGFDDPADDAQVSARPNAMILCNAISDMMTDPWIRFVIGGRALDKTPPPESLHPSEAQAALALRLSPLFHVKPGVPPALVMHGLDDHIVPPEQSKQFTAAMQKAGNRCDLVLIEGARHAFICTRYTAPEAVVVDAIRRADQFLISLGYLKGEPTLELSKEPSWTPKGAKNSSRAAPTAG